MSLRRAVRWTIPLVGIVLILGSLPATGSPTLTTITINGLMGDWATVLSNPDNVVLDGPAGGLLDADAPVPGKLDLRTIAYTWDVTYLYFYIERTASSGEFNYYWFHFDLDNDGLVPDDAPLLGVGWWGKNGKTTTLFDLYRSAAPSGDPIASGLSLHDGYTLPGAREPGFTLETLIGGAAGGREMEVRVPWVLLGVAPGTPFRFHVSSSRRINDYPGAIADNAGGSVVLAGPDIEPDLTVTALPGGGRALPHVVTNIGTLADTFDLTWAGAGGCAPTAVTFYDDADASGTLSPGDIPLADTDSDGTPDTGAVAGPGGSIAILAVAAIPPGAAPGQTCTVTVTARSSVDPGAADSVVDSIAVVQPALTLVKSVDQAAAPPGTVLTYTVTYANTGAADAVTVDLVDPVPAPTTYVPGSASGAGASIRWSHDGGLTWDASEAAPVTHVRWVLSAPVPPGGGGAVSYRAAID